MSDTNDDLSRVTARLAALEQANTSLRTTLGNLLTPSALWFTTLILLVATFITIVVPLDGDGVNAHPNNALGVVLVLAVPLGATMLITGIRMLGLPTAAAGIGALVLLHRERTEVFSDVGGAYWMAFASLATLTFVAALVGCGAPLLRAVVPGLAPRRMGYGEELRRPGVWWNPPIHDVKKPIERISLRD